MRTAILASGKLIKAGREFGELLGLILEGGNSSDDARADLQIER